MYLLEKYKVLIYYITFFIVTSWPFLNLLSSPINIIQAPYYEFTLLFLIISGIFLIIADILRFTLKINPIKLIIIYTFLYVCFIYYGGIKEFCSASNIPVLFFNFIIFILLFILIYLSNNQKFQLIFFSFTYVLFLTAFVDIILLHIDFKKPYAHQLSKELTSFEFQKKPNIYFLLLDAYPRHDTLSEERDNSSFLNYLKNKEFIVAEHSYSNYGSTWSSLSSIFQMSYLQPGDVINDDVLSPLKEVFVVLKKNQYDIAIVPSYFLAFSGKNVANIFYIAHPIWTTFYYPLSEYFSKSFIFDFIQSFASHSYFSLTEIKKLAFSKKEKPLFTFIHFTHAHDYAFKKNCKIIGAPLVPTIAHNSYCLEKLVEASINLLISKDPTALIIVQSDHGPWYWKFKKNQLHPYRFDRAYGIMSAFRLPNLALSEDIRKYLQDSPSPVNNFRLIFSLLSERVPDLLPYRAFISELEEGSLNEITGYAKLEKIKHEKNTLDIYLSLKDLGNTCSDEEIVKYILQSKGYPYWDYLSPSDRQDITIDIVSRALGNRIKENNTLPSNWKQLSPLVLNKIMLIMLSSIEKENLKQKNNMEKYRYLYKVIRKLGNQLYDEEVIKYILKSDNYNNWDKLIFEDKKEIINLITSKP